jgi:hypothetical protein
MSETVAEARGDDRPARRHGGDEFLARGRSAAMMRNEQRVGAQQGAA